MLSKQEVSRILKETLTGIVEPIRKFKEKYSNHHWAELKYEKTGDTILHHAARNGHIELMQYLIDTFEPTVIDCKNNDNKTALHEAAQFARYDSVELLLSKGAEVNALKRADWTPLMLACTKIQEDSYKVAELLLRSGALVNYKNKDGWMAFHLVCREGDVEILKLLLQYKADIHARTNNGRTGLHIAALHGSIEIVKELCGLIVDVNSQDSCGNIPLHEAVLGNNIDICKLLIENKAVVSYCNSAGFNLLHLAASQSSIEMIDYILNELKFDINAIADKGFTALHCAARNNRTNVYEHLVKRGAKENVIDSFRRTALDYMNLT